MWPGEFLIGQPAQAGPGKPTNAPGPIAPGGPSWAKNGSFLVFRRLRQDVAGWRDFVQSTAQSTGLSNDLTAAKLVGRYESGAPLELTGDLSKDPGYANPSLLADANVNNFKYSTDRDGIVVPLAAHIRKTNPRNGATDSGSFPDTLRRRIIRRGIPFGTSLPLGTPTGDPPRTRRTRTTGDCASSATRARSPDSSSSCRATGRTIRTFPPRAPGKTRSAPRTRFRGRSRVPGGRSQHVELMARFVTTTGGDYYFQPAVSALHVLATHPYVRPARLLGCDLRPSIAG